MFARAAGAGRAWVAMAALLAAGALAARWGWAPASIDWQPSLASTEPWRLWTAAFVHLSPAHLAGNLLGAALVAAFGRFAAVPWRTAAAWAVAWPLTHAALLGWPELRHYGGLSGVLHAGVAAAALHVALARTGRERAIGLIAIVGLSAKVVVEAPWRAAVQTVPQWDFPVAAVAHATGVAAGLACSAAAEAWHRVCVSRGSA